MDDKNFFENLGGTSKDAKEEFEVDLAKSGSALASKQKEDLEEDFGDEAGQLTIDVYQTPNEIIVESPIAGVNPEDIDISITPETVTIKGKRERAEHIKSEDYVYQECYWGKFSRSVVLPSEVDAEKAEANIKNGVLTIRLPKLNRAKSKKLKVKSE